MCMEYTSTLKGWVQTWYSDCQEQLEALNRQIYEVWQQEESQCQQSDADGPGKISVTHIDIRRLLEGKEQLLAQAEGKFGFLIYFLCCCCSSKFGYHCTVQVTVKIRNNVTKLLCL
ncbi:uncharacterized protein LOC110841153 [Zootermopsis nevadensis]|uniref:uncharacterized protein LOC110841153 n=1 Tax=Zootermopsis nevadensis TaxID=136037 RepID=UPI000B8E3E10|nr:uncharacterized protein LOC110841153 [Zootermopsis nevadensis]